MHLLWRHFIGFLQLFGSNIDSGQSSNLMWRDGILTSILRNIKFSDGIRAVTMHPDLNYTTAQAAAVSLSVYACSSVEIQPFEYY